MMQNHYSRLPVGFETAMVTFDFRPWDHPR